VFVVSDRRGAGRDEVGEEWGRNEERSRGKCEEEEGADKD
jgi:hypothetical protein